MEKTKPEVIKWFDYRPQDDVNQEKKGYMGQAIFRGFGIDYEELGQGVGMYSVALIELPDGSLRSVPVSDILFKKNGLLQKT